MISRATGAPIATGIFDAAKAADAPPFVQAVVERYGRIDIMVNNAGGIRTQPFPDVTEEIWDWTLNLNLKGPLFLYAGSCETDDSAEKRDDYQHRFGRWNCRRDDLLATLCSEQGSDH